MALIWLLAAGWGALAAAPLVTWEARSASRARTRLLAPDRAARGTRAPRLLHLAERVPTPAVLAAAVRVAGDLRRRHRARGEVAALARELPVAVDLLGVAVGAGCSPFGALELTAAWAPPAIARHLAAVPRACRLGAGLEDSLRAAGRATPALRPLADTLAATVRLGAPAAPALSRLAADARADLRRVAETRARRVPIRLLFPLVFLVLPAFGLLTVVPAVVAGFTRT